MSDMKQRGLSEVMIVTLDNSAKSGGAVDFLELQFQAPPMEHDRNLVYMLAPTLAGSWSSRPPGTVEGYIARARIRSNLNRNGDAPRNILDMSNPSNLSRCEFRVCMLIREGFSTSSIADALGICKTTVRSHLSSIYSKTGVHRQVELLHLMQATEDASRQTARLA